MKPTFSHPKVVLVLSSGAISGVAHLGVLDVLHTAQIPLHAIVGSSAGALIGLLYAQDRDVHKARQLLFDLWPTKYRYNLFGLPHIRRGLQGHGFFDMDKIKTFLDQHITAKRFEDLQVPLHMTAAKLKDGALTLFSSGPTLDALCASIAIPILFKPVQINKVHYTDGGIVTELPVHITKRFRPDVIIASDVSLTLAKAHRLQNPWFTFWGISQKKKGQSECDLADIILRPAMKYPPKVFDTQGDIEQIYRAGKRVAQRNLPRIREVIERAALHKQARMPS